MVTYAVEATKRFQFEASSGTYDYSQKNNCGPTCAAMIAGYYRGVFYGIETTRRLVTGPGDPTTYTEQRDMLIARGVPATLVTINSLSSLRGYVGSGRRPVILAVQMIRVPTIYRDHPFTGWHAVVALAGPAGGFWINDPNFSPAGGVRPDPDKGKKWWPDWVMQDAFIENDQSYAIVPNADKPLPVVKPPPTTQRTCTVLAPPPPDAIALRSSPNGPYELYSNSKGIFDMKGNKWAEPGSPFPLMGSTTVNGVVWVRLNRFGRNLYVRRIHIRT